MKKSVFFLSAALCLALNVAGAGLQKAIAADAVITLHGASQYGDEHPYNQGMLKFEELV